MQNDWLRVSHLQQQGESDCLPTCVEMVLRYQGISIKQRRLKRILRTKWFGTPFDNILFLTDFMVTVEHFLLDDIQQALQSNLPVIAGIRTGDLSYWNGEDTDHAVVVLGIEPDVAIINDPILPTGERRVPIAHFELARIAFNDLCAVIQVV